MRVIKSKAPKRWSAPCANSECSLHQLSPYIGKIKSSIAGELINSFSRPKDLIVDPFSGAGTIPFEATLRGRRAFAADISPYARILSLAKLAAPASAAKARAAAIEGLKQAASLPEENLKTVPKWVRNFFHEKTLREALAFARIARKPGNEFLMACFLGILHHQRPGFLSHPSSHLVPYLRAKKFPRKEFPKMYAYKALAPRLLAKVERSYKRDGRQINLRSKFVLARVEDVKLPNEFDAVITSPPYMNALDYGRDNRLRLWFIDPALVDSVDNSATKGKNAFVAAMGALAEKIEAGLKPSGHCIFVVGETTRRNFDSHPSDAVIEVMRSAAPSLILQKIIADGIPDIRRTRREYRGVKTENILVFKKQRA
jgi:hypothetical protein